MIGIVEDADRLLLEIAVVGRINVHKFLRIPVNQREPAALYLDHEPVPLFKRMSHIGGRPFYCLHLAGSEGNGLFEAFPEATSHDLGTDEHLITAHRITRGIVMAS